MRSFAALLLAAALAACATVPASGPAAAPPADAIAARTEGMVELDGFLPIHWNAKEGKILLEIPREGFELIHQVSLATGVGSNPIGLDRGQLGDTALVRFERVGPKVLMVQPNLRFRALNESAGESAAVSESFAQSVLWGFTLEAEQGGRLLVDATDFFLRDAHGVAERLRAAGQGSYRVDAGRSAIHLPRTKAFPKNTEVEATITLTTTDRAGALVRSVAPAAEIVTVRQHHSFVELPPPGYRPRAYDPRTGWIGIEVYDYSSPFAEPLERRWIVRHRLEKKNPEAAISEAVEPIVYWVDHAAPEPIRSALVDGAEWWKDAFEAAGFRNAYEVRILPEDADPMDIRYNVINWVHRSTRGWSYGASVVDPRTGEIIKGNVSLGSLRIRQDVMLASGLIPPYEGPDPEVLATLDPSTSPTEMALARIRQLSAHEVGHTLGIAHNFAASTYDRASVMDYPAPYVRIVDGRLDLSDAYAAGIGAFDIFAVKYGYSEFPPGTDEEEALRRIVHRGVADGMLYVADQHGRDPGSAHPLASVWDNGSDPIAMLDHEIEVRRIALETFGLGALAPGEPLSELEPILLPLYLHHRYQLEAALKSLGGAFFTYAVKEPGAGGLVVPSPVREIVAPERQRAALRAALRTLEPSFLAVPDRIVTLIPPTATGFERGTAERFDRQTTPLFDPIAAARASAAITLNALLHPHRAARLIRFHAENAASPTLTEVVAAVMERIAGRPPASERDAALVRAVREAAVARLIEVASNRRTDPAVRAVYAAALAETARRLRAAPGSGVEAADRRAGADEIERFLDRPALPAEPSPVPSVPAGPPIG
ncbi:MAG TPA: zinc-dependent metalloprotease [Thermoanaerobaculia bacterium]|nr:zinc-dependent metalloprotease [Thermoanaerobaculia bacterium]